MTTAFVLSGGCSLGAIQVGMLQALSDQGVLPDLLVGTSSGALNAAYVAGHGPASADDLAVVWSRIRRRTLFPLEPTRVLRSLTGGGNALCSDRGLRALVRDNLAFENLEDAPIPLHIVATDLLTGREVLLSEGHAESAVLASCALPAVFPSVHRDGRDLVDGGLADNTAISQAVALGADRVYVLPAGFACALSAPPRTPLGAAAQAVTVLTHQRLVVDVAVYADQVDLVVLPPPCPLAVAPMDFRRAGELIGRARSTAADALALDGGRREHPAEQIAIHRHSPAPARRPVRPGRG